MNLRIEDVDPLGETALSLIREAAEEIRPLYAGVLPPDRSRPENAPLGPRDVYVIGYGESRPIACGSLRELDGATAEVKRMYVIREHRRNRIARAVLSHLVARARQLGYGRLVLETGDRQTAAMALYESSGFHRIAPFGQYLDDPTSVCFERHLRDLSFRLAKVSELQELSRLMDASIRAFIGARLDSARVEASFDIMGLDTQLIEDGTYFVVQCGDRIAGCGGWSRRATLFGGDHSDGRDARLLDPATEPARVRAMYTHPDFARRGVGRLVLSLCEGAAGREGFRSLELAATVAGEPLYLACGFSILERLEVPTSKGVTVPLARMTKQLRGRPDGT